MSRTVSRKRPWLAALLGAVATGLGHLYLRRWRRAFGWLAVLFGVSVLFVDPAALEALANGTLTDPMAIAPVLLAGSVSVVDAYLLAHAQNAVARQTATVDGDVVDCPNCGKELDADIDFCHWCTTEIPSAEERRSDPVDERER